MSPDPLADPSLLLQPVSQFTPRDLDWLWPGRLAFGKSAILDGDPGLGKSLLALDLCARLSTGRPFPDGRPSPGPAPALILNGEDGAEDTIRPRLQAQGADLDRVFILQRRLDSIRLPLRFPRHLDVLERSLDRTGARLVVIDPIMAFLDAKVITASDTSVRAALYPLARLAERYRCVPLFVRHLNKTSHFRSLYRGGGSIGIVGACRSAWLVAADPANPERRIFAAVKNNLAGPQASLAFAVAAQAGLPATLTWLGTTSWTADQLLAAAAANPGALSPRERACEFLAAALADGPRTSRALWALAEKERLSRRTLRRAKEKLDIRSVSVWVDGKRLSYWLLPLQQLSPTVAPEAVPPDLEPWLAPLRQRFPPSTPIDDL